MNNRYTVSMFRYTSIRNAHDGVWVGNYSVLMIWESINVHNNSDDGFELNDYAEVFFRPNPVTGNVKGNGDHAFQLQRKSLIRYYNALAPGVVTGVNEATADSEIYGAI